MKKFKSKWAVIRYFQHEPMNSCVNVSILIKSVHDTKKEAELVKFNHWGDGIKVHKIS